MPDQQTAQQPRQILLTWTAPVRPHYERGPRWYGIGGALVVGLAAYGIISDSWLFSLVILLCGAMYYLQRNHVPTPKDCAIADVGFSLGGQFYLWNELERFWIIETPAHTMLHVRRKGRRNQDLHVLVEGVAISAVKTTLGQFVPEDTNKQETMFDMIIRICKL